MALKLTVAEARRMRGLTQKQVAEQLGISFNTYRLKENGTTKFYVDEASKLSEILDIPYGDLLFDSNGA